MRLLSEYIEECVRDGGKRWLCAWPVEAPVAGAKKAA